MTWDKSIAKGSQQHAEKLLSIERLMHASREEREEAGENLFMQSFAQPRKDSACKHAVDAWYVCMCENVTTIGF